MSTQDPLYPDTTSITAIAPEALCSPRTRAGYAYWQTLRGDRRFPAREEIVPRDIAAILTNMVLMKVIDGGVDFEFRIVGDHAGRGYRINFANRKLSEIARDIPRTAAHWQKLYSQVARSGEPMALDVSVGHDALDVNFTRAEAVYLPLGRDEVEYIATFVEHTLKA